VLWIAAPFVLLAALFLAIFPTRALIDQRNRKGAAARELVRLESENKRLDGEVHRLHTDAEIERLARDQYNLVRPGEEAYAILPGRAATPAVTTTTVPRR
jgi:cell division protein FtsB